MSERAERGFTLIELLVSLAILSIALAVLLGAISDSLGRTRRAKDEAMAASLVQSLLARAQGGAVPAPGDASGVYAYGFSWRLTVRPYGSADDVKAWKMQPYLLRATVSWREGTRSLSALKSVPVAP